MEVTVMEEAQAPAETTAQLNIESITQEILNTIEREREREIVARRFGLFDRRETLGQIGELLGITRERVRQLEKAVITRLKRICQKRPSAY
jgi:RNA polymerase primary sigma factor